VVLRGILISLCGRDLLDVLISKPN